MDVRKFVKHYDLVLAKYFCFYFCVPQVFCTEKKLVHIRQVFFLSAVTICFLYNKIRLEKSVQDEQGAAQFMEFTAVLKILKYVLVHTFTF